MSIEVVGELKDQGGFLRLHRDGAQIAAAGVRVDADEGLTHLGLYPLFREMGTTTEIIDCLAALVAHVTDRGASAIALHADEPLVRDAGRAFGLSGALRDPLRTAPDDEPDGPVENGDTPGARLAADLATLGVEVEPIAPSGTVGRFVRKARTGVGRTADVRLVASGAAPVTLSVPDVDDLLVEQVARIAATAMALMARFAPWWVLREIAVDRSSARLDSGDHAGEYRATGSRIALATSAVVAGDRLAIYRKRSRQPVPFDARPAMPSARIMAIDKTVAHEIGHLVWDVFGKRDRAAAGAIDVALGEALGVRRLADAVDGERPGASTEARAAAARLRTEVSDYAMTNVGEATAELFAHTVTGYQRSELTHRFGELLEEHLPPP